MITRQSLSGATDRKAVVIQQTPDLADNQHVLSLVIAAIAAPFDRFQLWKLLFPVTQYMRLYSTQVTYLTDYSPVPA